MNLWNCIFNRYRPGRARSKLRSDSCRPTQIIFAFCPLIISFRHLIIILYLAWFETNKTRRRKIIYNWIFSKSERGKFFESTNLLSLSSLLTSFSIFIPLTRCCSFLDKYLRNVFSLNLLCYHFCWLLCAEKSLNCCLRSKEIGNPLHGAVKRNLFSKWRRCSERYIALNT